MTAQRTLLQVILGEISAPEAARQLFEECLEITTQSKRCSIDDPAMDDFTAGYNQGIRDVLGEQRSALRTFFGQPEETT
jgi:glycosyltransferase A (GT-A) superfamily protein (DUF2064 family)